MTVVTKSSAEVTDFISKVKWFCTIGVFKVHLEAHIYSVSCTAFLKKTHSKITFCMLNVSFVLNILSNQFMCYSILEQQLTAIK